MNISKYLTPNLVLFSDANARDDVLHEMVQKADQEGKLKDKEEFYKAIIEREKIVSTSIGMGVAIPHAKLPNYDDFFIVIGILKNGIDWNALDGAPVRLVFMIGGPDDKQTDYLQILSGITSAIKEESRRKKMLASETAEAVINLFELS